MKSRVLVGTYTVLPICAAAIKWSFQNSCWNCLTGLP